MEPTLLPDSTLGSSPFSNSAFTTPCVRMKSRHRRVAVFAMRALALRGHARDAAASRRTRTVSLETRTPSCHAHIP